MSCTVAVEKNVNPLTGKIDGIRIHFGGTSVKWEFLKREIRINSLACNPYAYRSLIKNTISTLMKNWTPVGGKLAAIPSHKARQWAEQKFSKLINWAVYPHWQEYISKMDGADAQLAKMLFMADIGHEHRAGINILQLNLSKAHQYEISNYKLAAIYATHCGGFRDTDYSNWRQYFTFNGKMTNPIKETLETYNHAIPWPIIKELKNVNIIHPLTKKIELVAACSSFYMHKPTVIKSHVKAIKEALKISGCLNLRKSFIIKGAISSITNDARPHNGDIVDLAQKTGKVLIRESELSMVDDNKKLNVPIVQMEPIEGIKFVETVGELRELCRRLKIGDRAADSYISSLLETDNLYLYSVEENNMLGAYILDRNGYSLITNSDANLAKTKNSIIESFSQALSDEENDVN